MMSVYMLVGMALKQDQLQPQIRDDRCRYIYIYICFGMALKQDQLEVTVSDTNTCEKLSNVTAMI